MSLVEKDILIVVKAYPSISQKYEEIVCTAGITAEGQWIRLYPLDFRNLPFHKRFKKYQWITASVIKHERDNRKESYRIDSCSIKLGKVLGTKNKWEERKLTLLPIASQSLEDILDEYDTDKTSLAIFKPAVIDDFVIDPGRAEWKPKQQGKLAQMKLFGPQPKSLEKIPWKFSYKFHCNGPRCKNGHTLSIHDWEINQLYRKLKHHYKYAEDVILQKIKQKYLEEMCGPKRDTYFVVGTVYPKRSFIILGTFWPEH